MGKKQIIRLGLVILILSIMTLGYGGWCRKKSHHDTTSGSSGGGGKPDLVDSGNALDQLIPSSVVHWGEHAQALCMVGNDSDTDTGAFYVKLYASTDSTISTSDYLLESVYVTSMLAWDSEVQLFDIASFPSISAGDYYIGFIIDSTNAVAESNESNNTGLCTSGLWTVSSDDVLDPADDIASNGTWLSPTTSSQSHGPHTLSTTDNYDWFRINMTACHTYYFNTTGGSGDSYGELYSDSAGSNLVASDDDSGGSGQFSFSYTAANTQTYYLKIRTYTVGNAWSGNLNYYYSEGGVLLVSNGFRPHLSPDATRVVFTRLTDYTGSARSEIWIINIDGTGETRLTTTADSSDYSPQWTPDGQSIVFVRKTDIYFSNTSGTIWQIDPDGTNLLQRWSIVQIKDFCFYVKSGQPYVIAETDSPSGDLWLSVNTWPTIGGWALRRENGSEPRGQSQPTGASPNIVIFDGTLTGAQGAIVFNPVNLQETIIQNGGRFPWPCLSPSGTKLVAGADGGVSNGLYKMDINGNNLVSITTSGKPDHQPSWSGNTIVFVRIPSGGSLEHGDIRKITGAIE